MENLKQIFLESANSHDFLIRSFTALRSQNRHFTLAAFAKRAGFKSRSYPHLLLSGKRSVNLKNCDQISMGLKLPRELATAFRIQVQLEKNPGAEYLIHELNDLKIQLRSSGDLSATL